VGSGEEEGVGEVVTQVEERVFASLMERDEHQLDNLIIIIRLRRHTRVSATVIVVQGSSFVQPFVDVVARGSNGTSSFSSHFFACDA
jgi:hypothetical protein